MRLPIQTYLTERSGASKVDILSHSAFWFVLGLKVVALFLVGSSVLTGHYIPFVSYFIDSGFSNPYEHFSGQGVVFPFPALMLYLIAASKMLFGLLIHNDLFSTRVPILVADIAIFLVLTRWLKDKQTQVLWFYWCSPILFAINYVGGFLDIVPMAFLFAFLYFLFKEKYLAAFVLLGLALATKTGIVIVLPFVLVYLIKEYVPPFKVVGYLLLSCSIYLVTNGAYLLGPGFLNVLFSGEHSFTSSGAIDFGGVSLYVLPLVYLGLLVASYALKRLHKDMFLLFLAFAFGIITLFVVPEPGWYCWILPFFVYFFVKEERAGIYPFVILNIFYFTYFLLPQGSTPAMVNMAFTLLQGALLLNIVWIYVLGIRRAAAHKILYKPYLVGIAGDSASGKSTLTALISKVFGEHNTLEVAGDDMHKWERGDQHWSEFTHLNPLANKLHEDMEHALRLKHNESIKRHFYDHAIGRFTLPTRVRPKKIIVLQGLHTLYLSRTRALLDLKIFLSPNEDLRRKWKVERDIEERGSTKEKVLEQLDARIEDSERYIREQRKYADVVISIDQSEKGQVLHMECDNSINVDPFIQLLKEATTLEISHEHGNEHQLLRIVGDISSKDVDDVAYTLVPEVGEINRRGLEWESGLGGILQLFVAYVVFYKAKVDHDTL